MALPLAQQDGFFRDRAKGTDECVADNGICPQWAIDNFDRYVDPFFEHLVLVVVSVAIGFAISFALAVVAHRRRWLVGPITQATGILYTIPSLAAFFLLLPVTGRGRTTAIVALTAYTLFIFFRNFTAGLDGVPEEARDAGRGMGFTDRQLLWRVELPLALPAILAGLRIALTTTVGLAALAFYAGGGRARGGARLPEAVPDQRAAGRRAVRGDGRAARRRGPRRPAHPDPVVEGEGDVTPVLASLLSDFGDAIEFIFVSREGRGGAEIGGSQVLELTWTHLKLTLTAIAIATADRAAARRLAGPHRARGVPGHLGLEHRPRRAVDRDRLPVLRDPRRGLLEHHAGPRPARHPTDPDQRLRRRARGRTPRPSTPRAAWA